MRMKNKIAYLQLGNNTYILRDDGKIFGPRGEVKGAVTKKGYLRFHGYAVHRLIALAFVPNPENKPQINHKNLNKTDNRAANLEWATNSENIQHSYDNGRNRRQGKGYYPRKTGWFYVDVKAYGYRLTKAVKTEEEARALVAKFRRDVYNGNTDSYEIYQKRSVMGRPKRLPETVRVSVVVPKKYLVSMDKVADKKQISRSAVLRLILEKVFPNAE